MFKMQYVDHIALTVKDRARSTFWYQTILGMERHYHDVWRGPDDPVMLCTGKICLALFPPDTAEPLPSPDHNTLSMRHFALRLDRVNFEQAQVELRRHSIEFDFQDHKISHSIYFFDPDGHQIELTTYEF